MKSRGFPKEHKMKLFRVAVSDKRTDWVMTNDLVQCPVQDEQEACALRWKIWQFHRKIKQLAGARKCRCSKARIRRKHIACAVLVWVRLAAIIKKVCTVIHKIKSEMPSKYFFQKLPNPSVRMEFS